MVNALERFSEVTVDEVIHTNNGDLGAIRSITSLKYGYLGATGLGGDTVASLEKLVDDVCAKETRCASNKHTFSVGRHDN
jgi:hypothetical protein